MNENSFAEISFRRLVVSIILATSLWRNSQGQSVDNKSGRHWAIDHMGCVIWRSDRCCGSDEPCLIRTFDSWYLYVECARPGEARSLGLLREEKTLMMKKMRYSVILAMLVLEACVVQAQVGDNAVFGTGSVPQASGAFVDVAAFCGGNGSVSCYGTDFCTQLHSALHYLTTSPQVGGVADARGVVKAPGVGTFQGYEACGSDPFSGISTNIAPITVLLPAFTINMAVKWTLLNNVRLVGEGEGTRLEDGSTFTDSNLIDMGSSACSPCSGISIEHLQLLQANHPGLNAIVNDYAAQSSYVNDVRMGGFRGTGISIQGAAANSGPYTNISFVADPSMMSCSGSSCPVCVDIEVQTQGLHGITCSGNAATGAYTLGADVSAGIKVNGSNNTIKDVHLEVYWDGIRIGDVPGGAVSNVVVSNVNGEKRGNSTLTVTNIVHICGPHPSAQYGACPLGYGAVTNVSIFGARDVDNTTATSSPCPSSPGSLTCSTAIQDDVTGASMAAPLKVSGVNGGISVGFYALGGEIVAGSVTYSQFATTPTYTSANGGTPTPSLGIGGTAVSGSCNTPGALYSNKSALASAKSVYVCTGSPSPAWVPIP